MKYILLFLSLVGFNSCGSIVMSDKSRELKLNASVSRPYSNVKFTLENKSSKNFEFPLADDEMNIYVEVKSAEGIQRFVSEKTWNEVFVRIRSQKMARVPLYRALKTQQVYKSSLDFSKYKEYTQEGKSLVQEIEREGSKSVVLKLSYREAAGGSSYGELQFVIHL